MRKFIFIIMFICISLVSYAATNEKITESTPFIEWTFSIDEAINKSEETDMPMMISIYADFSKDCMNMDKKVFSNPKVIKKSKLFIPVKLNALSSDDAKYIMDKYSITGYPYIIFIDKDTETLNRTTGDEISSSPSKFLSSMDKALNIKEILPNIKTNEKPTIEALDYYIEQYNANKSYEIFNKTLENNEIYSINNKTIIYTLNDKSKAFYFYKIAGIYFYQKKDLENAKNVYIALINNCKTQKDYINQADMNIIRIFNIQGNDRAIKNYINEILLRDNLSKKHTKFYTDFLKSIE